MKRLFAFLLASSLFAGIGLADEGMWLYNKVPADKIKAKYGWAPSQAWLDHLRLSSVRLGASASFVSPDGLIFTNHHVGAGCVHDVSTAEHDYMRDGFYAKTRADEPKCPGLTAAVLQDIEDVTVKVNAAVKPDMSPADVMQAQRAAMSTIEKDCSTGGLRCEIVTLYAGAQYHLYKYRRYTDLRLVFAPEYATAFFGGDPDNFTYPRYDLDITFLRAYENGQPAKIEHYLKWSKTGVKEGDLVFVSGHPGSTGRLLTYAQMEQLRDNQYPRQLKSYARRIALLQKFGAESPENARIVERQLFGLQNSNKAITGYQSGLLDAKLMAQKLADEKKLREQIAADPKKKAEFGDPWADMERAMAFQKETGRRLSYVEGLTGFWGTLPGAARGLARVAEEKSKPNPQRLREYRDSALPDFERRMFTPLPVYKNLELLQLTDSLTDMRDMLGADDPFVQKILGGKEPADVAKALIDGTKLDDVAFRKQLYEGGAAAIAASDDPLIVLMRNIDGDARAARKQMDDNLNSIEQRAGTTIAKIMFAERGFSTPPDATGTLRLSYGAVKSYLENGKRIPYFTTFRGAFEHAAKHENKPPYQLADRWMEFNPGVKKDGKMVNAGLKAGTIKLDTPLNFVDTSDIIGGNSGSPVVNKAGEVVGIIFDGNIQQLPNRFVYRDEVERSVSVDARGIIEALRSIYAANGLADELVGPQPLKAATPAAKKEKK